MNASSLRSEVIVNSCFNRFRLLIHLYSAALRNDLSLDLDKFNAFPDDSFRVVQILGFLFQMSINIALRIFIVLLSLIFLYFETAECNKTSDWLNRMVWPIRSFCTFKCTNLYPDRLLCTPLLPVFNPFLSSTLKTAYTLASSCQMLPPTDTRLH